MFIIYMNRVSPLKHCFKSIYWDKVTHYSFSSEGLCKTSNTVKKPSQHLEWLIVSIFSRDVKRCLTFPMKKTQDFILTYTKLPNRLSMLIKLTYGASGSNNKVMNLIEPQVIVLHVHRLAQ